MQMSVEATKFGGAGAVKSCEVAVPSGFDAKTPETVLLRRAVSADADALAIVGAATFLEAFTWMIPGEDIVAHCRKNHTPEGYAGYLSRPATRITLAVAGPLKTQGAPVGFAMVCAPELPELDVEPTDVELKRIYLFSRFRHAAVMDTARQVIPWLRPGQALMDAAVADAREMGKQRLLLGTHEGNERAIAFYRRNGFTTVGSRVFQVGSQRCCDLILGKVL